MYNQVKDKAVDEICNKSGKIKWLAELAVLSGVRFRALDCKGMKFQPGF